MRHLLPATTAALVLVAVLRWLGQRAGLYGTSTGVVVMTVAGVAITSALVLHFARGLGRSEAARAEAEAALQRSARFFELTRDLACTATFDGYFSQMNSAWTTTLGWSEEELSSRPFIDFVHPDDREATERESAGLAVGGVTVDFTNRYATKDGRWVWLDWRSVAAPEERLIYAAAREVTDRKVAEQALEASEHQHRAIIDAARDAFVATDADGRIVAWNPAAERTFGWTHGQAIGRTLRDTVIPESGHRAHERGLAHFKETGEGPILGRRVEVTARHRDGHEFPVEMTILALETAEDLLFHAFLRDISERKEALALLERQRRQLVEAQSVGGFGSWEYDPDTGMSQWSAEAFRLYGLEPRETMPFDELLEYVHPDDRAAVAAAISSAESFSLEHRIFRADGELRVVQARCERVAVDDDRRARIFGTVHDVTERRAAERAKDEFTAMVSHELRTPLTSIRGSLGLLQSGVLGPLPEKGQRMVDIAVENTDRLVRLINDILDIERIDSGQVAMELRACDAADLLERSAEGVRQLAVQAGVRLVLDAQPVPLQADPDRVLQALTNLISNAIKFSPADSTIWLSSARHQDAVRFAVRDEGRGIPVEKLESIFGRFQQVDASDSREKGGTGLGLAICRTIADGHGGSIEVASVLGAGSTFSLTLPAGRAAHPPSGAGGDERPTVLLCDDDVAVVEVVTAMLEQGGYRVIPTHSGEQALDAATSQLPDAILLDLRLPSMSGEETAAVLTRRPETRDIPIIVCTVVPPDRVALAAGPWFDWIEKPIDEAALFGTLLRATTQRDGPPRVLVVEDDGDLAQVLTDTLIAEGVETFHARDGRGAIDLSQSVLPDLLVLDLGIPGGDGYDVVAWLRRHERLRALPLLIYTGRDLDDADRARLRLGASTEFLTKADTTPEVFREHVLRRLDRLDRHRTREARHVPEAPDPRRLTA